MGCSMCVSEVVKEERRSRDRNIHGDDTDSDSGGRRSECTKGRRQRGSTVAAAEAAEV